ncbi:spermidine synthase [Falsiroseomonas stagni]|uniref:Spermidine synthase n=1 Tax=Falsiroseomonas stagni DSM 19981 TaxID=1123062 RepID=A0A1I4A8P9_9PROT|nr:hypothetical protein [Falsiroseomonas stagni]SFK52755.1 hypothetical protein SAMN02745775_103233 [Falsiroseomonas stagni DSM 19981]
MKDAVFAARPSPSASPPPSTQHRLTALLFAATVATSAALLFAVQPMLGKALLPPFGGGAAVWTAVMLFFQLGLLAGSALFHLTSTRLGPRGAAAVHLGLALLALPLLAPVPPPRATGMGPAIDVLATLAVAYGPAVLVLGANAAALQAWYARVAGDAPWWLYAVSNAGSLAGLAAYPLLLEPYLALSAQGRFWTLGFAACALGLLACAWPVLRHPAPPVARQAGGGAGWRQALPWVALAALPASLLLGATERVTVTIAPLPLLWVLPLAAYLLSWILAFWRPAAAARWGLAGVTLFLPAMLLEVVAPAFGSAFPSAGVLIHVGGLLAAGTLAHARLALARPEAAGLTRFYLCLSLGGALGGTVNALLAPMLFDRPLEYPLALAALCLLPAIGRDLVPKLIWGSAAALLALAPLLEGMGGSIRWGRDFYGAVQVQDQGDRLVLAHGRTLHGYQWQDPARALEPTGYYHREAGGGRLIAVMSARRDTPMQAVLVGLGAGAMACYGSDRLRLSYIEISPAVVDAARRWFTFLRDCGDPPVVIADGRVGLRDAAPGSIDLVVLDAYSGASVPVHMATAEGVALFLDRLAPGGAAAFHASNTHFDLPPLIAAAGREAGAQVLSLAAAPGGQPSVWVAVTRDAGLAAALAAEGWAHVAPAATPWRDDRWHLGAALRGWW